MLRTHIACYFREFQDKMKVFGQFNSSKEHEKFFENIQSELLFWKISSRA